MSRSSAQGEGRMPRRVEGPISSDSSNGVREIDGHRKGESERLGLLFKGRGENAHRTR